MTISTLLVFAVPFGIAALIPGPAQTALVARVIGRGQAGTLTFVLGMVGGNAVWFAMTSFGLSALAKRFFLLFLAIKWAGILYLLALAAALWRSKPVGRRVNSVGAEGPAATLTAGMFLSLGNPKAMVFFSAILPTVMDLRELSWTAYFELAITGLLVDFSVQSLYAVSAFRARALLQSSRCLRLVNRSAASLLTCSALAIAARET